jgi:hypothetical protein
MAQRQSARDFYQPGTLEMQPSQQMRRYPQTAIIPDTGEQSPTAKPVQSPKLDNIGRLRAMIMKKYRNDLTADTEVIYNAESGKQIGSNLSSLVDQVLRPKLHTTKSFDRDLFIFYTVKYKRVPLTTLEKVNPEVRTIYNRMHAAMN